MDDSAINPPGPADRLANEGDARLVAAFWRILASWGWEGVTLRRLAVAAEIDPASLRRRCPDRLDLLRLHERVVDQAVLDGTVPDQGGAARDRLFDVLMRRIDALQPHRAGVLRLMAELRRDPLLAVMVLAELPRSMARMLEAAEVPGDGAAGFARSQGLTGIWLATLRAWAKDDSQDLGATMAALDRALDRAGTLARSLGLDVPD